MRGSWWWIDRWRKSTAFTDMTLEEQGAYRNLLDEVVLREDGCIPFASMQKASGDPVAWPRLEARVLKWMRRCPTGWTNDTALEVKGKGALIHRIRSEAGAKGAANREANRKQKASKPTSKGTSKGTSKAQPPDPDPYGRTSVRPLSVSVAGSVTGSGSTENGERNAPPTAARASGAFVFSSQRVADLYRKHYPKGTCPPPMFKALRPLCEAHGWEVVAPELEAYLAGTEMAYQSWPKFAAGFGKWATGDSKRRKNDPSATFKANLAALEDYGDDLERDLDERLEK